MIVAGLYNVDPGVERIDTRAYLADTPFPGDTISSPVLDRQVLVVRRNFIDYGDSGKGHPANIDVELAVRYVG